MGKSSGKGVYRVVRPSLCGYTCPTEKPATNTGMTPSSTASVTDMGKQMMGVFVLLVLMF
uniref:Uncharacterized protein n=1 Tax=Oryza punctata TaxID=4537 RepID=A0A0E0JJJ3_ORYPU